MISIIIYNKNNTEGIEECLNSIVSQDYSEKEIIFINDASEDNSWQTLLELIEEKESNFADQYLAIGVIKGIPIVAINNEFEAGFSSAIISGCEVFSEKVIS